MTSPIGCGISGLDHIVLEVADVEASVKFYEGLGLAVERLEAYRRGEVKFPSMRINERCIIDLFAPPTHESPIGEGRNMNHFALVSELPVDELRHRIVSRSIKIEMESNSNFGARGFAHSLYVRDPDDNRVEIRTYADSSGNVRPS